MFFYQRSTFLKISELLTSQKETTNFTENPENKKLLLTSQTKLLTADSCYISKKTTNFFIYLCNCRFMLYRKKSGKFFMAKRRKNDTAPKECLNCNKFPTF